MTLRVRLYTTLLLLACLAVAYGDAAPSLGRLLTRQAATGGSNTDGASASNGGAGSAESAAQAAGNSIDTGAGGDRSTPTTQAGFAKLLSGTFFGCLLGLLLGGAFFVQCWAYFDKFGRKDADARAIQLLVAMLGIFSGLSVAVLVHRIWSIHVRHFGDFAYPLLTIGWELTVDYICIAFMASGTQLYFATRVWNAFGKSLFIAIPFGTLIGFTFCGGIASGVLSYQSGSAANVRGQSLQSFEPNSTGRQWSIVFATWLICSAAIDVGLCALLFVQVLKMKSPFFSTRHAVARMLTLSVETCSVTVGFSLCAVILFLSSPENFFYLIPFAPIGQVYACSVVATLMKRASFAKELAQQHAHGAEDRNIDTFADAAPLSIAKPVLRRIMKREEAKKPLQVQMTTVVHQVADEEENYGYDNPSLREKSGLSDDKTSDSNSDYRNAEHAVQRMHGDSNVDYHGADHGAPRMHPPFSGDIGASEDSSRTYHNGTYDGHARPQPARVQEGSDTFEVMRDTPQMPGASVMHPFQGMNYDQNAQQDPSALTVRALAPPGTTYSIPEERQSSTPSPCQYQPSLPHRRPSEGGKVSFGSMI